MRIPIGVLAAILLFVVERRDEPQMDPAAIANDNRTPAGVRTGDTLVLRLVAVPVTWHLNSDSAPGFRTLAFSEEGRQPTIPAPLIRVRVGTWIDATVRNPLPDTLIVQGLGPRGDGTLDSIRVAPGASERVRFPVGKPGTYMYRGFTSAQLPATSAPPRIRQATTIASQLAGAFVVDSAGPVPADRIMVLTTHVNAPNMGAPTRDRHGVPQREFPAINGKAWPYSERLTYALGDSIRWRIVNASVIPHPMHLHGFYFRIDSRGSSLLTDVDSTLDVDQRMMAVTEVIPQFASRAIAWSPDRPGGWIFHCHLTHHVVPMPPVDRSDSVAFPSGHHGDPDTHTVTGMSGLITAITVTGPSSPSGTWRPARQIRLFVQSDSTSSDSSRRFGYVMARGSDPKPDSVQYPGPTLVLTRGQPTRIVVINRSGEPTAVHWHGIEIDSYYDGAAGWSGTPYGRTSPAIRPGRSFEVRLTPARAGTFMYHTHLDELRQQHGGLVGTIVVLEPGERWDPAHDLLFLVSDGVPRRVYINGTLDPAPVLLTQGEKYRIRLADLAVNHPGILARMLQGTTTVQWRPIAKDGFPVPPSRARPEPAFLRISSGETADFEFVPDMPGELQLEFRLGANAPLSGAIRFRVQAR